MQTALSPVRMRFVKLAQPFLVPRAEAASLARKTGVNVDTTMARVITGPDPSDAFGNTPRMAGLKSLFNRESLDDLQPPAILKPTLDLVAYLAGRCEQVYSKNEEAIEKCIKNEGGSDFQRFHRWTDAAFAYRRGSTAIIVIRGTYPSWNLVQWIHSNLLILPAKLPFRHLGFWLAWRRLRPTLNAWLKRTLPSGGDIVLAGHSLGGAIAILGAFELAEQYPVRAVVTLGSPRVGLSAFRDKYLSRECRRDDNGRTAATLGQVTRRITHADDVVSRVPPPPLFRHVGQEERLDKEGNLSPGSSRTTFERCFLGFDSAVSWSYAQLYARSQARSSLLSPAALAYPAPPKKLPSGKGAGVKQLLRDLVEPTESRQISPVVYLSMHALYLILMIAGTILAIAVFILAVIDLRSHECKLYVEALGKRYEAWWKNPPLLGSR